MARLVAADRPFGRPVLRAADGRRSVRSVVLELFPDGLPDDLIVLHNGEPLTPAQWGRRLGAGGVLVVARRPGAAAAVLAAQFAVALVSTGAAYGAVTALGLTGITALVVGTAVGTAAGALASLALRSLVPPASALGRSFTGSRYWSVELPRNATAPYQPVPIVLGRHRVVPHHGAAPLYRVRGGHRDALLLLSWGEGPLAVEDLRLGNTPIVTVEHEHQFWAGDYDAGRPRLSLYPVEADTLELNVSIPEPPNKQVGGWFYQTTGPDPQLVELIFSFPSGLQSQGRKTGDIFGRKTQIEVETSPVGQGQWTPRGIWTIERNTTSAFVYSIELPADQQLDIRIRRWGHPGEGKPLRNAMVWSQLVTWRQRDPVLERGVALSALRILATEESAAAIGSVSGLCTSIVPAWNGESWEPAATRNPAALARWLLTGRINPLPLAEDQLDAQAWADWYDECEARGWTCDLVVDAEQSLAEVLRVVGECGRAQVTYRDGRFAPVIDLPRESVAVITPRNAANFRFSRDLSERPHGLRVQYLDAAKDYSHSEVLVYADGYDETTAVRLETYEVPGITDRTEAARRGHVRLRELEVRAESVSFSLGYEYLTFGVGDVVDVVHPLVSGVLGTARVREVHTDAGGNVVSLTLDTPLQGEPGVSYAVRARTDAGVQVLALASPPAGRTVDLATPTAPGAAPQAGDLVAVVETSEQSLPVTVLRIAPETAGRATVEGVRYDPSLFAAYDETPNTEAEPPQAAVSSKPPVVVSVAVERTEGTISARLSLVHLAPPADAAGVRVQWRAVGTSEWAELEVAGLPGEVRLAPLGEGSYEARVAYDSREQPAWSSIVSWSTTTDTDVSVVVTPDGAAGGLVDLQAELDAALATGASSIAVRPPAPGRRIGVPGSVRIEQPDPTRHVTVDLSALSVDAGKGFRITVRGELVELPETNTYLLDQDAPAGSTTIRVRTTPQGGDHSLLEPGRYIVMRGQNDAWGDVLEGQKYEGRITSKTVISSSVVELGIDPPLPSDFQVSYPDSEWVEEGGGVDQTHISVYDGFPIVGFLFEEPKRKTVIVSGDAVSAGWQPGDVVLVVDDMLDGDVQGSQDDPIRREPNAIRSLSYSSGRNETTITFAYYLDRDFAVARNARVLRVRPAWNVRLVPPADVRYVEAPDPAPAPRRPALELRYAVDCSVGPFLLDDQANPWGYAPRGPALRIEHCLRCRAHDISRVGKVDMSDATSGDRYGIYALYSRHCEIEPGRLERCRHGLVYWCCTGCTSRGGVFVDNAINGLDFHGGWSVDCIHHGGLFVGGESRAPDASNQSGVTIGNTSHLAGDYGCGIVDGVFRDFHEEDGAVEIRTPVANAIVSGVAINCKYGIKLAPSGSIDGGAVIVPRWHHVQAVDPGMVVYDITSGSPKFQPVILGEVWSDHSEPKYWPSGSSGIAPVARQNFALHAQRYTGVSGNFKAPYTRGQWIEVELAGDVTSFSITTDHLARTDDLLLLYVLVRQDATGGHLWAHPANTTWPGGTAPGNTLLAGQGTLFQYLSTDGGSSWLGLLVADNV